MTRRRESDTAWTPHKDRMAALLKKGTQEAASDFYEAWKAGLLGRVKPREVRVVQIRVPNEWAGHVVWLGDSWEQSGSRLGRWHVGVWPQVPIIWGELPPTHPCSKIARDGDPDVGRSVAALSVMVWQRWLAQPIPCAIGRPVPIESTAAWERRIYVNGRRAGR